MSSPLGSYTSTIPGVSSSVSKTWKPSTNPIHFHSSVSSSASFSTALGRIYTLSQTAFLLSYFILRFKSLVAEPVQTMIEMVIPLVIAQAVWCITCLPRSGYWDARTKGLRVDDMTTAAEPKVSGNVGTGKGSLRRKGGVGIGSAGTGPQSKADGFGGRVVPLLISLILTISTLPPPLILLAVLMGAPATTHTAHTSLLAVHVALLVGPPLFYTHGVSGQAWREIMCAFLPFDEAGAWGGVIGALIGGWLGAIPIPLDWDREWQKWPVTIVTGVWLGWAIGRTILGPAILRGKRIDLRETDAQEFEKTRIQMGGDKANPSGEIVKKKKTT